MKRKTFSIILGVMIILAIITTSSLYLLGKQVATPESVAHVKSPQPTTTLVELSPSSDLSNSNTVFRNSKGDKIALRNIRNKVIFINMWATWCPPCRKEMPSLNRLYSKLKDNPDIIFIMMDVDGKLKESTDYVKKKGFDLPNYILEGNLPESFQTNSIPTTIIIDKSGKMVTKHMGGVDFDHPEMLPFIQNLLK
ncbi:TlpA family protein disulfide reductase [Sphingobacterium sp. SYP-B4668]|uniref:TlpA family protein disulfide reductase n=1 Tax=Sphingobacterium sp. SYP-B4668 TaxID=2996035 RepID=UPI0022DE6F8A|nr:TlpA disulfide reductase family protein [Sphingobacterium sp. SYP-B4668]